MEERIQLLGHQQKEPRTPSLTLDRVDPKKDKPRPLQVEQMPACIDFAEGAIGPVVPVVEVTTPVRRERIFHCEHFSVWRHSRQLPFTVGAAGVPHVLICIAGAG